MEEYITNDEKLTGWEVGFFGQSWFKKDKAGNTWQAYPDEFGEFMQFRIMTDKGLTLNGPMCHKGFEERFND